MGSPATTFLRMVVWHPKQLSYYCAVVRWNVKEKMDRSIVVSRYLVERNCLGARIYSIKVQGYAKKPKHQQQKNVLSGMSLV